MMYRRIGKGILKYRTEIHMTQTELAKKVGISRPALANIELGRQRVMLHTVFKFEKALGLTPLQLLHRATGK